jgi:hypothetical protein
MLADRLCLRIAGFVQSIQQTLQVRIIENGHSGSSSTSLRDYLPDAFARTRARTFRGVSGYARNLEQTRPSFQNEAPG